MYFFHSFNCCMKLLAPFQFFASDNFFYNLSFMIKYKIGMLFVFEPLSKLNNNHLFVNFIIIFMTTID